MALTVLFNGYDVSNGLGLWKSDGTAAGTSQVKLATPRVLGLDPSGFTPFKGKVLFAGSTDADNPYGLWITDGTGSGTIQLSGSKETLHPVVPPIDYGSGFCACFQSGNYYEVIKPSNFTYLGEKVLFTASSAAGGTGLWVTDSTADGTSELSVAGAGTGGLFQFLSPSNFGSLGSSALFTGYKSAGGAGLWVTDGTGPGTVELQVTGASASGLNPLGFARVGNELVFSGHDRDGKLGLWASDGTAAGTAEIEAARAPELSGKGFVRFGAKLLFRVGDGTNYNAGLSETDGTAAGTTDVPVFAGGALSAYGIGDFAVFGSKIVFSATNSAYKTGLWLTDGTAAGTVEIPTSNPWQYGLSPGGFTTLGDKVLFSAIDSAGLRGLWITDGTAVGTIELQTPPVGSSGPTAFTVLNGKALFNEDDGAGKSRLWVTDGTALGTTDITTDAATSSLYGLKPSGITAADLTTPSIAYTDTTTGVSATGASDIYTGPVSYLNHQFIWNSGDAVAIAATSANVFLHGGAADDALTAVAGSNVLDGGLGSNFLTGATGADGGTDTFFVDGRGVGETWSTVNNFHHGDAITLWGFVDGTSTGFDTTTHQGSFVIDGAAGYKGATIHSETNGAGSGVNASFTISGLSVADAAAKLTLSTGSVEGHAYLYISYTG